MNQSNTKTTGLWWRRVLVISGVFVGAGGILVARRRLFPRQQDVLTTLLPVLRAEPEVRELIGSKLVSGTPTRWKYDYRRVLRGTLKDFGVEMSLPVSGELSSGTVNKIEEKKIIQQTQH